MSAPILVSACLLGLDTRYNRVTKRNASVLQWLAEKGYTPIPVCPEQLGGLPTPRPPADYREGDGESLLDGAARVVNRSGAEIGAALRQGAEQTLLAGQLCNSRLALLKERSPSCGVHAIYRNGVVVAGRGATAALLVRHGFTVFSEADLAAGNGREIP